MSLGLRDIDTRTLAKGEYNGYEWLVGHNEMGFRCGYIRVLRVHPWFGIDHDNLDADVHGGLTYSGFGAGVEGEHEWWLGFDCAHLGDAPDPSLPHRSILSGWDDGVVRTQEYVEAQCRSLIDQAGLA